SRTHGSSRRRTRCGSTSPHDATALPTATSCTKTASRSAPNRTPTATAESINGYGSTTANCVSCSSTQRWSRAGRIDGWYTPITAFSSVSNLRFQLNNMSASSLRASSILLLAVLAIASGARAQEPEKDGRFITGPLAWTPTFELRDAGIDSNVFNTPT